MSTQSLSCRCGKLRGRVTPVRPASLLVCYCRDCQAFAHFLGRADQILDEAGGTTVVQTMPAHVSFDQGRGELACVRLGPRGLLRWYARCCQTAIGCTPVNPKFSLLSLVGDCLPSGDDPNRDGSAARSPAAPQRLVPAFGPLRLRASVRSARGVVPPPHGSVLSAVLAMIAIVARGRLRGRWRRNPFFDTAARSPIVTPRVLSRSERSAIMYPE